MQLPKQHNIDITALAAIFKHTTNSYKFLLFQSLLLLVQKNLFKQYFFSFGALEKEMIEIATYPINVFKLNFGTRDQMAENLNKKSTDLLRYVPYRLLTPFFENELQGLLESGRNQAIEKLSNTNRKYHPIYKINGDKIELYPEWMQYFKSHFAIIEGWVFWHWTNYLQSKNPNVTALVSKLRKPPVRTSLNYQTKYWENVLAHQGLNCIFSQKPITKNNLSLDHFLPWNFIGHDQLWNLFPINQSVNSAKSDNIPSMDKYLDKFVKIQILGLEISYQTMNKIAWEKQADDFVVGLNIKLSDLINNDEVIKEKYYETMLPLANIAHNMGFNRDWVY